MLHIHFYCIGEIETKPNTALEHLEELLSNYFDTNLFDISASSTQAFLYIAVVLSRIVVKFDR